MYPELLNKNNKYYIMHNKYILNSKCFLCNITIYPIEIIVHKHVKIIFYRIYI